MDGSISVDPNDSRTESDHPGIEQALINLADPRNPYRRPFWFFFGLSLAAVYAALPLLIQGYTYPPGDDPVRLEQSLEAAGWVYRYYGHFPAAVLGMTAYYYLTPVLIYFGLYFLLSRYGAALPAVTWAVLFLVDRVILFDLYAGSFVGLVSFYFLGFGVLRLHSRWLERRASKWVALLAPLLVLFHSFTGLVFALGVVCYAVAAQKLKLVYVSAGMIAAVLISAWGLQSSISRIGVAPDLGNPFVGAFVEYSQMEPARFIAEYLGLGTILVLTLGLMLGSQALARGWRPSPDMALGVLAVIVIPLAVATFTPLALNADRTAKLLVGVLTILSLCTVWQTVPFFRNGLLPFSVVGVLMVALAVSAPEVFPYWMSLGTFR